ncbi:MAG: type IV toxin-antitoxin system AbiEi family antitoxin domain-containing protein [Bacteroidales bacterium]
MNAKEYIKYLLSIENYSFSVDEISKATDGNSNSLKFELHRLSKKGEIINLRKGFYLIITPRYSSSKKIPIQLYCVKSYFNILIGIIMLVYSLQQNFTEQVTNKFNEIT